VLGFAPASERISVERVLAKAVFIPRLHPHLSKTMGIPVIHSLLALAPPSPNASPEDAKRAMMMQVGMIVFMLVIFWVLLIRPQQKKAKEQADLLKGLKAGDKVITTAGIIGIVTSVRDDSVTLRSADTKLEFQKASISQIVERAA
jgi:preprotein translocase subunit YajC